MKIWTLLFLTILGLSVAAPATALIYKYQDENGRIIFVDDESKIPAKFRKQTDRLKDKQDRISSEEYQQLQEQREQEARTREANQEARKAAKRKERQRALQTPITLHGNYIMVPVEVSDGHRTAHLIMLLDTGASTTVIHRSAIIDLKLNAGKSINASVAGGQSIKSEKVKFSYIEVGPFRHKERSVMIIDPNGPVRPFDGMLGMDFLKQHPYTVDYENERILWQDTESH